MKSTLLAGRAYFHSSAYGYESVRTALELRRAMVFFFLLKKKNKHCLLRLNDQPKAKSGTGKKPAATPFGASKTTKAKKNPLFEANAKNFGISALSCRRLSCYSKTQLGSRPGHPTVNPN